MDILEKLNHWADQPGNTVYLWVGIGITVIAVVYLFRWIDKRMDPFRTAHLRDVVVSGNLVAYTGTLRGWWHDATNTKIEILNAEDGKVIKTRVLYDYTYKILLTADGMIWTKFLQSDIVTSQADRPLQANVLDINTLETRYDNEAVAKHFQFESSEKLVDMILDKEGTRIVFVSNTGNTYSFASPGGNYQTPGSTSGSFYSGMGWPNPFSVKIIKPNSRRYLICLGGDIIGTESFFEPVWVNGLDNEYVEGIVIVHPQTIDPFPFVSLTLLGLDGKIRWTVTQQSMGIAAAKEEDKLTQFAYCGAYRNVVIYKVDARIGSDKIIAINIADGKIVWAKHF